MKKLVIMFASIMLTVTVGVGQASAEQYKVQKNDTLWNIANEHNITVEQLMNINDLKSTVIKPKEILLVNEVYTVKSGDSLEEIAKQYQITVEELKSWNNIKSDKIIIGQELKINGSKSEDIKKTEEPKAKETAAQPKQEPQQTITVTATAYTANCDGCSGITYTGIDLNKQPNAKVIAVDPKVIPLGTKVYVEGYGQAVAADIGSAIKGNKIDLYVPTTAEAIDWGRRTVEVTILD